MITSWLNRFTEGQKVAAIVFLCIANLIFAHYYVILNCQLEMIMRYTDIFDNISGVLIDICCIFVFCLLVSLGRLKTALLLCFGVSLLWSFSNVLYFRFFEAYLSLAPMGQAHTLFDELMFKCMIHELRWVDCYYLLSLFLFILIYRNLGPHVSGKGVLFKKLILLTILCVFVALCIHVSWCLSAKNRRYVTFCMSYLYYGHVGSDLFLCAPRFTTYTRGFVRTLISEKYINSQNGIELSADQIEEISKSMDKSRNSMINTNVNHGIENVIFILVESYMSFTSGLKVAGEDITPNLNRLRQDSTIYYNGKMCPNITIGESSDGQFIYMTGLLPLRSLLTISRVGKMAHISGLAKVLKDSMGLETRMIIPTVASVWNQDRMCQKYGFDKYYSSSDYPMTHSGYLNDYEVFKLAKDQDKQAKQPFFSVILTMSMHQPYKEEVDPMFKINDLSLTTEQRCYLNACHYTDAQIGDYLDFLKKTGIYEKSLIVIAADHDVKKVALKSDDRQMIPLYIINGGIPRQQYWQGECQQLDVYPTLLNLLGLKPKWSGLGHSLLNPEYENSVTDSIWKQSEWVVLGENNQCFFD